MPYIEVEVKIYCECGEYLDAYVEKDGTITVDACRVCTEKKYNNGFEDGYNEGLDEGRRTA